MTVSTTTTKISYAGDGTTVAFAVPFVFFGATELELIERVIATGVETVKTLATHYTVAGGAGATGTVTAVVAPPATVTWTIARKTARTQLTDYLVGDAFPADTHERALDRLTAIAQEIAEAVARTISVPVSDTAAPGTLPTASLRANKALVFDASGTASVTPVSALASITAAASVKVEQFVAAGGAAAFALSTVPGSNSMIEVSVAGAVQAPGVDYNVVGSTLTFSVAPSAGARIIARWIVSSTVDQVPVYAGSDSSNLDYPIGTTLAVYTDVRTYSRNQSNAIRRSAASTYEFCDSAVSGTTLTGTWRARGMLIGQNYTLFQRTA